MTPDILKARLLRARQDEVRRLSHELEFTTPKPWNFAELTDVLRTECEAIQAEIQTIQREREESHSLSGATSG
ncbi:MAG: hypothetical protein ACKVT0_21460 [Planctomycetaceae bacterium]